jgi:hypothetical protein
VDNDIKFETQMTATLKTAIEIAAEANGQSVNAWVVSMLEAAVLSAQEIAAEKIAAQEERGRQEDARKDKWLQGQLGHMGGKG